MKPIISLLMISFFLNVSNAQDWKWKNPLPTGNILNCVKFADMNTAFAVGEQGTIIKSTNRGLDWEVLISGTNTNLTSISVIDKDTLYVSGEDLTVLKTTDGGITWINVFDEFINSNTGSQIFFLDPANGYFLSSVGALYKTEDYAQEWTYLETNLEFQNVTSIFFTSVDTGYASVGRGIGGITLKTVDGGINWSTNNLPSNDAFNSIVFIDDTTGYLVGLSGTILKTINSGNTWIVQNESPSTLTNHTLHSVDFINERGYIVGAFDILRTVNGGDKWELLPKPNFDLFSVSFYDENNGIAVGGDWLHEYSGILVTSNGGTSWQEISSTITPNYIDKIKFLNSDIGYAVGGNVSATFSGFITRTTDSGNSWTLLNTGTDTYWLYDINIFNENKICVVGDYGQIFISNNAGSTWEVQESNTSKTLRALHFVNNNVGYAVGAEGTLIKTTNGGSSWENQDIPTEEDLYSLYFINEDTGYIPTYDWGIDSTVLLKTTDGGNSWEKLNVGLVRSPCRITFVNSDTAFIAGDFGGILKTTDGWISWERSYHNGNDYMDIFFIDENTGYVVGEDGEISKTEDCGNNWTVLNSGTERQLRSVFFTDINTGYVAGADGAILKTTNSGGSLKPFWQEGYILCKGDSVLLEPQFIGGTKPLKYRWGNSDTTRSIFADAEESTTYSVTIFDNDFDSINIEIPVYVTSVPTPTISQNGDTIITDAIYETFWYRNDTLISENSSDKIITDIDGKYYCITLNYPCYSEKSNIIWIGTNGIEKNSNDEILIYPNPISSFVTIESQKDFNKAEIFLYDVNGIEIKKDVMNSNLIYLDLNDLPNGIYIIKLILDDKLIIKKIIKN